MLAWFLLALMLGLCLLAALAVPAWIGLGRVQAENTRLQALRGELTLAAAKMQAFESTRQQLEARRKAVEVLRERRQRLARLLPAVSDSLPDSLVLLRVSLLDERLELQGRSPSALDVSTFQGLLGERIGPLHLASLQVEGGEGLQFRLQGQVGHPLVEGERP